MWPEFHLVPSTHQRQRAWGTHGPKRRPRPHLLSGCTHWLLLLLLAPLLGAAGTIQLSKALLTSEGAGLEGSWVEGTAALTSEGAALEGT